MGTIAARHALYRSLACRLRDDPSLPAELRAVRFFEAAARVTGPSALGMLQRRRRSVGLLMRLGWLDAGSCACIEALNAWLLERNLEMVDRLVRDGPGLRSPLPGLAATDAPAPASLSAPDFDAAMVVFEQRAVDAFLLRHPPASAARRGIDRLLGVCAGRVLHRLLGIDADLARAIRLQRRRDGARFTFFAVETRIAIGQQLVRGVRGAPDAA